MRRLGCLAALVGVFVFATSVFLFSAAISRLLRGEADNGALALGGAAMLVLGPMLAVGGGATVVFAWMRERAKRRSGEAKKREAQKRHRRTENGER